MLVSLFIQQNTVHKEFLRGGGGVSGSGGGVSKMQFWGSFLNVYVLFRVLNFAAISAAEIQPQFSQTSAKTPFFHPNSVFPTSQPIPVVEAL